jgi:chaperone required for assembly of F1-ATPase
MLPLSVSIDNGAIACELFARNISTPATKTVPVRFTSTTGDTVAEAWALLDRHLPARPTITVIEND